MKGEVILPCALFKQCYLLEYPKNACLSEGSLSLKCLVLFSEHEATSWLIRAL